MSLCVFVLCMCVSVFLSVSMFIHDCLRLC
eukprot:SAG11_NODE_1010_length_6199_cov_2.572131_1_plen_29_part_10